MTDDKKLQAFQSSIVDTLVKMPLDTHEGVIDANNLAGLLTKVLSAKDMIISSQPGHAPGLIDEELTGIINAAKSKL
jgi:hypothetical protein